MRFLTLSFCCLLSCAHIYGDDCPKDKTTTHKKLKDDLLCGYDSEIRPVLNKENATQVTIKMVLKSLGMVAYQSNTFFVNSWLAVVWKDEHLTWKPSDYDGIKSVHMSSDSIWNPDLSVYNRPDQSGSPSALSSVNCLVFNSGAVVCIVPSKHEALCEPDLRKFPFDRQNCTVRYGSWVHTGEELNLKISSPAVTTEDFVENGEWKLVSYNVSKHPGKFNCCPDNTYPSLNYNFIVDRHSGHFVCASIIPIAVLTVLTILSLCLDPADRDRQTLIVANIFTHFLAIQYFFWEIPMSGPDPPLLLTYVRDSMLMATFTLVLTVCQKKLMRIEGNSPVWMSAVVAKLINSKPGRFVFIFDDSYKSVARNIGNDDGTNIIENSESQKNKDWIIFARVLDKICLFIYTIVFSTITISLMTV